MKYRSDVTGKWRGVDYENNREIRRRAMRKYNAKARKECMEAYGGRCVCCGEAEDAFLCIDHINGNGNIHRKAVIGRKEAAGSATYWWLRKQGYPKDNFQILCYNCNNAKHKLGYCPHKKISENSQENT